MSGETVLVFVSLGYLVITIARYIRARRRSVTLGDMLLSNLVKHKIQTRIVS